MSVHASQGRRVLQADGWMNPFFCTGEIRFGRCVDGEILVDERRVMKATRAGKTLHFVSYIVNDRVGGKVVRSLEEAHRELLEHVEDMELRVESTAGHGSRCVGFGGVRPFPGKARVCWR